MLGDQVSMPCSFKRAIQRSLSKNCDLSREPSRSPFTTDTPVQTDRWNACIENLRCTYNPDTCMYMTHSYHTEQYADGEELHKTLIGRFCSARSHQYWSWLCRLCRGRCFDEWSFRSGTRKSLSWHLYSCHWGVKKVLIKCCVIVDVSKTSLERSPTRSLWIGHLERHCIVTLLTLRLTLTRSPP